MPAKPANFRVKQNWGFWKRDTTVDFEKYKKAPIYNNTGGQFRSVTRRNINETETPLHKTPYFNFCSIVFFWYKKIGDGYFQFRYIEESVS